MRNRRKTLLRDHLVLEVILKACLRCHSTSAILEPLAVWGPKRLPNQFCVYLQYQPFHVKTDNNPLTYVMSLPNLDATGHRWVAALANFNMSLEYQKGNNNTVADCLSQVTKRLDKDSVKELMQWAKSGGEASCTEADDPEWCRKMKFDNEVILQAKSMIARKEVFKNVADKHWIWAQKDDPVLHHIWEWLTQPKGDKQTLLGYLNGRVPDIDCLAYTHWQKDLVLKRELK